MATTRKRGNSYQIRVSCGYDTEGHQVVQTMTWKPAEGMTKKQIEKELQRQAILFEEKCLKGQITANIKFQDFAEQRSISATTHMIGCSISVPVYMRLSDI